MKILHQKNRNLKGLCVLRGVAFILCVQSLGVLAENPKADVEISGGAEQDSNLNIVELDKNTNESDTALLLNAKADVNWKANDKLTISGGYSYSGKKYQHHDEFNLAIHQLYVDANYDFSLLTAGASHHFAKAELNGNAFLDLHQTSVYISKLINGTIYLRAAANEQDKAFAGLPDRNATNKGFSGDLFLFSKVGKTFVNIGVANENENARANQFDYKGINYKARVSHSVTAFGKDNKLQLGWRYTTKDYSGVTPEIRAKRYDSGRVVDASWEISMTPTISLETKIERGKYNSNVAAADYAETRASIVIKARF